MNCSTFRKKIYDYIEENVVFDMKEAMDLHMTECDECRNLYEEEQRLEELLKKAFSVEDVEFVSSRAAIIKSIDKNKYVSRPLEKPFEHLKKYGIRYVASAAVLFFAILIVPSIFGGARKNSDMAKSESSMQDTQMMAGAMSNSSSMSTKGAADNYDDKSRNNGIQPTTPETKEVPSYSPVFENREKTIPFQSANARPWTTSPNGKLEATVEGKGAAALEEGVATIVVNDKTKNKMTEFYLSNNKDSKYTPMFVEWLNDGNLLVVVGDAHGTLAFGGNLYEVNINESSTTKVYETKSNLEQVMKVTRKDNLLAMTVRVFKDNSMSAYIDENREIDIKGINIK